MEQRLCTDAERFGAGIRLIYDQEALDIRPGGSEVRQEGCDARPRGRLGVDWPRLVKPNAGGFGGVERLLAPFLLPVLGVASINTAHSDSLSASDGDIVGGSAPVLHPHIRLAPPVLGGRVQRRMLKLGASRHFQVL